jgi:cell division protein ZapA (FtsZ GTPase activity inhibitor)
MAALNISNELLQNRREQGAAAAQVSAKMQKLSDRVADAVSANKQLQI